jgi:hypothetical protein
MAERLLKVRRLPHFPEGAEESGLEYLAYRDFKILTIFETSTGN